MSDAETPSSNDAASNGSASNQSVPHESAGGTNTIGFGPVEGLRALTNLQRQGITAATEVAERFTALLDGFARPSPLTPESDENDPVDGSVPSGDKASDADAMGELRSNVARGFDLYSRMFQTTFESWADLVEDRMRDRGVAFGSTDGDAASAIGPAGGTAEGELWLHNHTADQVGPFQLIASPAFSADGTSISPAAFKLTPASISVPGNTSSRVEVTVDLREHEIEGVLHAIVLVRGLPDEALPLRVVVQASTATSEPVAD